MFKITDTLATHGLSGENYYPMKYVECKVGEIDGFKIVDVRPLLDGCGGNSDAEYKLNIARVTSYLENGDKVVICCRAGISRSNAIALMVLVKYYKMDYYSAFELIKEKVPIAMIALAHLDAARRIFKVPPPLTGVDEEYLNKRNNNNNNGGLLY